MTRRRFLGALALCGLGGAVWAGDAPRPKPVFPGAEWEVSTPAAEGVSAEKLDALKALLTEKKTQAAVVIRHGKIVAEWYWDGKDKDSRIQAFSVTKSIASAGIGLLVKDGKVKLDQPAADFIPEWKGDARKEITVRHLITMTSGLENKDNGILFQKDQLGKSIALPLGAQPGTVWNYNNGACNTLSQIISAASGKEMGEFLNERLYGPLGIANAKMDASDGKTLAYMGLNVTARDLARFGCLFLHEGRWKKKALLPKGWVAESSTTSQERNKDYGYLWWVRTRTADPKLPKDSYSAVGFGGQYLSIFPSQDLIVVRLTSRLEAGANIDGDALARAALDTVTAP
jgi:CubicO group peptidase (beta-lactamase class C family)